jgi:hypothetical protein
LSRVSGGKVQGQLHASVPGCPRGRVKLTKILIEAGADRSVRDVHSENLLHAALKNDPVTDKLREFLDRLDPELRSDLFLHRNHLTDGGDTPIHMWLKRVNTIPSEWGRQLRTDPENEKNIEMMRILIEYSGGHDLGLLNDAGETVLHSAVFRMLAGHMRAILESDPKLLYRENSVGRTPFEIAYDRVVEASLMPLPSMAVQDQYEHHGSYAAMDHKQFLDFKWRRKNNSSEDSTRDEKADIRRE